jgi:chitinase
MRAAAKIVDYLKLMCYDYYGPWSSATGHNANLYNNPLDPAWGGWSTDQGLDVYIKDWIPAEKIMLGVAFYGRGWDGVPSGYIDDEPPVYSEKSDIKNSYRNKDAGNETPGLLFKVQGYSSDRADIKGNQNNDAKKANNKLPGLYQSYKTSKPFNPEGSLAYSDIKELLKPGSGFTRYWDDVAKAPYLYNGDIMLSYTDEELVKLITDFAKEKKTGGVFVWEYGHDLNAELMKVLYENMQ